MRVPIEHFPKAVTILIFATAFAAFSVPTIASAYVGPGAGITAIGTILAFVAMFFLAIVGFVWYPVKRLLKKNQSQKKKIDATEPRSESVPPPKV